MQTDFIEFNDKPSGFDIKKFFLRVARNYLWFFLSVALFVVAAYYYLKHQIPMHQVSTSILLHPEQLQKESSNNFSIVDDEIVMSNENMKDLVNNEIFILKSRSLITKVVDSLNLQLVISKNKKLMSEEALPFIIKVKGKNRETTTPEYALNVSDSGYNLTYRGVIKRGRYGQEVVIASDTILLKWKDYSSPAEKKGAYSFQVMGLNYTVGKYLSRVSVSPVTKAGVGMVQVSVKDEFYNRAKRIIEVLIFQFNSLNVEYKNQAEKKTLNFLNARIGLLEEELRSKESQVSSFKSENKIYDISASANQLLNSLGTIDVQKSQNDLKDNLLTLVEKNVDSFNGVEEIVPNSGGLQDEVLIDQINQYNKLVLNKRLILDQGTKNDPRLLSLNGQLEQLRTNILKNVSNIRDELSTTRSSLSRQEKEYSSKFGGLPEKEKQYIQLNRNLGIKESLYVYLLQKREESSLRLVSSDMAQSRIIDEGIYTGVVFPDKRKIYLVAVSAGFFLPFFVFLLLTLFKRKIESRDDIEEGVALPIAGEIGTASKNKRIMIVSSGEHSVIAEQLRTLRSNLFYQNDKSVQKTVLITSYMRGEGKSFISLNFADALAAAGKKVILLDFDLRKGILTQKLNKVVSPGKNGYVSGLADFLNGEAGLDEIISPADGYKRSFFFIPTGKFVSNPAELILNEKMDALFSYLKSNSDFIIIDSPPVGFVADAIMLGKWCDESLFIIRHNYTLKNSLKLIKDLSETHKLPPVSIVVNGIKKRGGYEYGGYGYGYHYNNYIKNIKTAIN